jgi:hypothetical protein
MEDSTSGLFNMNSSIVYRDGVLDRCTYHFGHGGKHSWEKGAPHRHTRRRYRGAYAEPLPSKHDRDDGKLSPEEAEELTENDE